MYRFSHFLFFYFLFVFINLNFVPLSQFMNSMLICQGFLFVLKKNVFYYRWWLSFRGSQWWEKLRELTKEEEAKAPVCTEIKCYFKCLICKDLVSGLSTESRFDFQDSFHLASAGGSGESLPWSTLSRCLCKRNAGHEDRVTRGQNTGWMIFTVFPSLFLSWYFSLSSS